MDFIFRPLDAEGAKLRKQAQRLASTLPNAKGVANRLERGYILRAVGDGKTVIVTAIPPAASIGGAYNAQELIPGEGLKHVVFHKCSGGGVRNAVLAGGALLPYGLYQFRRYIASGRKTIGSVSQLWPLGFIGDLGDGWVRSPPENTVQGQCRLGHIGAIDSPTWATKAVPSRTALLTLHTPLYREAYYTTELYPTNTEHAVSLFRLSAACPMLALDNVLPDHPPAIKTDIQADYSTRDGGDKGTGIVEFSTQLLGVDGDISPGAGQAYLTEGALAPIGCFEWGANVGCIAINITNRSGVRRTAVASYTVGSPAMRWLTTITAPSFVITPGASGYSMSSFVAAGGMWATRAGRGLTDGTPDKPDTVLLLAHEDGGYEVDDPQYADPIYVWQVSTRATILRTLNPTTGAVTNTLIFGFDTNPYTLDGAMVEYQYAHALGVTVGSGATAAPMLVCCRRTVPYAVQTLTVVGGTDTFRLPIDYRYTAVDEFELVSISVTGAVVQLSLGDKFPAYYMISDTSSVSPVDGKTRLLGQCDFFSNETQSANVYDPPVCEFAPGYVAVLAIPNGQYLSNSRPVHIVICDVVTGALVHTSPAIPDLILGVGDYVAITCAKHGVVVDGVASGGVLLVTARKALSTSAQSGCFATLDIGATYNRVFDSSIPGTAMHYLGDPLTPNPIGGGW